MEKDDEGEDRQTIIRCPTCGSTINSSGSPPPLNVIAALASKPIRGRMYQALINAYPYGRHIDVGDLASEVEDMMNGRVEVHVTAVYAHICHIRKALEPLGWTVSDLRGATSRTLAGDGGYRLEHRRRTKRTKDDR